MSQDGVGCKDCKRIRERVASLLPFKVVESTQGKPLHIGGVAMATGMSRNFNVYTPEELTIFAEKLVNAPVYIEHVTVEAAAGKVTKCNYDAASPSLLYEADLRQTIADKVRNGLIQHVSVGAPRNQHQSYRKSRRQTIKRKTHPNRGKLSEAEKPIQDLRKQVPGGGLLKNPPKMMAVSEYVTVLEGLLPPLVIERSSMGMQRQAQAVRAALFKAKERLSGGS